MTARRYFVIVYKGSLPPTYVRSIGPFSSEADAKTAAEGETLADAPMDGEWATVIPDPQPSEADEV